MVEQLLKMWNPFEPCIYSFLHHHDILINLGENYWQIVYVCVCVGKGGLVSSSYIVVWKADGFICSDV